MAENSAQTENIDPRSWVLEIELGDAYAYLHTVNGPELDYA